MEALLYPNKAAYVRGGEHADTPHPASPDHGAELKTAADDYTRRVLLTFDLSPLMGKTFARVFFHPVYSAITGKDPMKCDLYRVVDDWCAQTVTWNTRPALGECFFRDGMVALDAEMDVTEELQRALANGEQTLSLCMVVNHHCQGIDRAVVDVGKTVLLFTDEEREAYVPTLMEDDPSLTKEQRALLPYLPPNWQFKISSFYQSKGKCFCMTVQTDTHSFDRNDTSYGNNAKAVAVFTNSDVLINLGDMIRGYKYPEDNTENLRGCMDDLVRRYTENCPCPVLMAIGNHDHNGMWCKLNGVDDLITKKEHFDRVQKPLHAHNGAAMVTDGGNVGGDSLYSYVDLEKHNVRVIMVDSTDDGENFNGFKVSERQLWWLENVALKTEKQVIVMTHTPFFVEFPNAGNRVTNGDRVMETVERFVADGGKFIAYLYGHTHGQSAVIDENGRRHMSFVNGGSSAELVMIDTQSRTIKTIGFGNSADRSLHF